jgi:nicotinamidase-related amidase
VIRIALLAAVLALVLYVAVDLSPVLVGAQPIQPVPEQLVLDPATTALLVIDLGARCVDMAQPCNRLVPVINEFLPRFRGSRVLTIYNVGPDGMVWPGFQPLGTDDIVIQKAGPDKLFDGELDSLLRAVGIKTLVITGASANGAVLYTATSAVRNFGYEIVIPLDGTVAANDYEYEYTMHQLIVLTGMSEQTRFSTLGIISFEGPTS